MNLTNNKLINEQELNILLFEQNMMKTKHEMN